MLNCHTLVSRIFGITNRATSSSVSSEREPASSINISQNYQSLTLMRPPSEYISASVEIKVSAATGSKDFLENFLTNHKAAEFVFNSPLLDTLKVQNIYDILEESKEEAKDFDFEEVKSDTDSSFSSILSNNTSSPPYNENLILTLTNLEFLKKLSKSSIIEVLFILSKLMFGTKKIQVQRRLKKAGIINVANKLYSLLVKTMDSVSPGQDMKIQILKLVINYLSRDSYNLDNKLEWISQEEILMMFKQEIYPALMTNSMYTDAETKKFTKDIAYIPTVIPLTKYNEYDETKLGSICYDFKLIKDQRGFMSKIIQSFTSIRDETINSSNLRYWQASWIESFTRGCNPYLQLFVARSGILKFLIKDIITIQTQDDANLQTAFDILGEMIRFNKRTLLILESHIKKTELQKFKDKWVSHLIDSNVFIRSLWLTLYKLTTENESKSTDDDSIFNWPFLNNSEIWTFANESISKIINGILSVINWKSISQTNLSWLNTVIIIFIMAKKFGKLSTVVKMLESDEIRENLKELLKRWDFSYSYRPRDSYSLQFTTQDWV